MPEDCTIEHLLVCGGCGFIGSSFVHLISEHAPGVRITVADALTYAGSTENLQPFLTDGRVSFVQLDISEPQQLYKLRQFDFSYVINFAAETHVDRSLYHADRFVRANVLGTQNLLAFSQECGAKYLHISTDEVYGPAGNEVSFSEDSPLNPTSPYAASKAAADLLVLAAIRTHGQNATIVRTCNNYGPRQYPEKLIPFFLHLISANKPLPVYGDGLQRRSWLYVEDFCLTLLQIIRRFPSAEVLNVGSENEFSNLELVRLLLKLTDGKSEIKHVADRPAHDQRYSIDSSRHKQRFGEIPTRSLENGLKDTIKWYRNNPTIFERLQDVDSVKFRKRHYSNR